MIPGALDEDVKGAILRGVRHERSSLDLVSVRDTLLRSAPDIEVLAWAATEGRVLFTHDARTMTDAAYRRITAGQPTPGVFVIHQSLPTGIAVDQIVLILEASEPGEWEGQVRYLPL